MVWVMKTGTRYPSGDLKPPSAEQRAKFHQREADKIKALVRSQPHRANAKDPDDKRLESALGRFCIRYGLDDAIFQAALYYAALKRRWRRARNVPKEMPLGILNRIALSDPSDLDSPTNIPMVQPAAATVDIWEEEIAHIEWDIAKVCGGIMPMRDMVMNNKEPAINEHRAVHLALYTLALRTGHLTKRHPFERI